ncbi:MAG TPA: hypothetical protein VGI76_03885 [Solirubrobacteraceae bacterium]|jgi:hypothetical protein
MTEVTSVNGKIGAVVLKATDVEAVPGSSVGEPNGVASLNASGKLPETELPSAVVSGSPTGGVTAWKAKTQYQLNQLVQESGIIYICKEAHESGTTFSGVGTHWEVLAGSGAEYACPPPTENSTTDTANVEACLKAAGAGTHGVAAITKPGVYHINKELNWPTTASIVLGPQTVLLAVASMTCLLSDSKTEKKERQYIIGGGVLDSNNLADHALWPRYFQHYLTIGVQCRNSLEDDVILGDSTASAISTEAVLLPEFRVQRTSGSSPAGQYCVWSQNCSDGRAYGNTAAGQETGFRFDHGGWRTYGLHPVGAGFPMQVCIDDGSANWHQGATLDTPTPKEHAGASGSAASSTITDAEVIAQHKGRPVTGANIPAESFVGSVTEGVSFTLVNAKNEAVKPAGTVAGIALLGVGALCRGTSVNLEAPEIYIAPAYGVDNGAVGMVMQPGATVHGGNVTGFVALGGSESFRVTKVLMGNLEKISWRGLVQTFVVSEMPTDQVAGTILETKSPSTPGLLFLKNYNPEEVATLTTESTTLQAIDATHLPIGPFLAPPSGQVLVKLTAMIENETSSDKVVWGIVDSESHQVGPAGIASPSNTNGVRTIPLVVPNLTPGQSYTWSWAWAVNAGKALMKAGHPVSPTWTALATPAVIEIWAA